MFSHQGVFTFSKQGQHKCCLFDTKIFFFPFKWQMIKRIQARIFCLARGLKVLNLSILFLLPTQIGLVTRQLKYLISFANSYILIEAASVHDQCCQYKHSPTPNLCWAFGLTTSSLLQTLFRLLHLVYLASTYQKRGCLFWDYLY